MNTSFNVKGLSSKKAKSTIAHIQRKHKLKNNPLSMNAELSNSNHPHIIIHKKARFEKIEMPKISRTQRAKTISKYVFKLKKYEKEFVQITDPKKKELKLKTIKRNKKKIKELTKLRDQTIKQRANGQVDFVDIPFSITECPPSLLNQAEFDKLSNIAIEVTHLLFEIDDKLIGATSHLDQSSAHCHITFQVPTNKSLKQITKLSYREAQLIFNEKIREAFPNLKIEKICDNPNPKGMYVPLSQFKQNCKIKTLENDNVKLKNDLKSMQVAEDELKKEQQKAQQDLKKLDRLEKENYHLSRNLEGTQNEQQIREMVEEELEEAKSENQKINKNSIEKDEFVKALVNVEENKSKAPNIYKKLADFIKQLKDEIINISKKLTDSQKTIKEQKARISTLEDEKDLNKQTIDNLEFIIEHTEDENKRLIKELENLQTKNIQKKDIKI